MHLCIPLILEQNQVALATFSFGNPKILRISGGTVVLSAADSNRPIAGGNRSSTKNPFPTLVLR